VPNNPVSILCVGTSACPGICPYYDSAYDRCLYAGDCNREGRKDGEQR
jgi:hypothetical protein